MNGVHGRNGPLSFVSAHQESEFVGFLQLVQLLVTGNRRIFFSLFFIHQTLHWHDTQQGKSLSLLSLIPAWMRCKRDGTDTKISRRRVGVQGVGRDWWSEGEFCQEDTPIPAMGFVRSLHFYRKVPQDVTEATLAGGVMSLLALLAMGVLAVQHVSHFARVELETKVEVDEFADQPLRIEFNVCNATHRPNLRHPHLTESTRAHLRS